MRFVDGPAVGVSLMCRRAPMYLRVTQDAGARKFDALDQPGDEPEPQEILHVYSRVPGTFSSAHLCARGSARGASGWYEFADYAFVPLEDTERFRDVEVWRGWATAQPEIAK